MGMKGLWGARSSGQEMRLVHPHPHLSPQPQLWQQSQQQEQKQRHLLPWGRGWVRWWRQWQAAVAQGAVMRVTCGARVSESGALRLRRLRRMPRLRHARRGSGCWSSAQL